MASGFGTRMSCAALLSCLAFPLQAQSFDFQCSAGYPETIQIGENPLLPTIPNDAPVSVDSFQCGFDAYSWNLFLSLNRDASGVLADPAKGTTTEWQAWPESSDIFLPDGSKPAPVPVRQVPEACQAIDDGTSMVLSQIGKRPDVLEESTEPFNSGPLIDANGWYARFAISVNPSMYDYIVDNQLYNTQGQKAFTDAGKAVTFTCSCKAGDNCDPTNDVVGAVMVKAAWKVMDTAAGDEPGTFYTSDALVYTPATDTAPANCVKQQMGLAGFHIAQKNHGDPQWLWSSFEHLRNAPTSGTDPGNGHWNFFSTDCPDCTVNAPPPQPWNPLVQPVTDPAMRSQVERAIPITSEAASMTDQVHAQLLGGTVWENYQLVSTQWPTAGHKGQLKTTGPDWCAPLNPTDNAGAPAPAFMANTTLETYIQGTVPQASSTCINCHLNATMTDGRFSDFTYLLERAQPEAGQ